MAINAYIGLMGSGKSFEVVASVILPAIRSGRTVVTNIDGINPEAVNEYLIQKYKCDPDNLGKIVSVTREQILEEGFFPDETKPEQKSIVQGGDLVAIDECWNFWGTDNKIPDSGEHMRFFRMHRHYTNSETGITCDLVLMIQDLGTLNRKIRVVIEMTSRTVKLKSLGAPTAYRVELYEGNKTTKLTKIDTFVKTYDKSIFPLYKSYAAGSGNEKTIDKRQNIFTNPRLWGMLVIVLVMFSTGGYFAYRFFQPATKKVSQLPSTATGVNSLHATKIEQISDFSDKWRYGGSFKSNGEIWAILVDPAGRVRVESPSMVSGNGLSAVVIIDGKKVTTYTGSQASISFMPNPAQTLQPGLIK